MAFAGPTEGTIVDAVRDRCPEALSLVAVEDGQVVGHVLFSPVAVEGLSGAQAMGLGPMAVLPGRQRRGVGSALVREGMKQLAEMGCALVVVLGHAEYYPRFGFSPAGGHGLQCQWPGVPDEAFMVRFLQEEYDGAVSGTVRYREEFNVAA